MADYLTYFIAYRLLAGDVNGIHFQEYAVSGGRSGRKDTKTGRSLAPVSAHLANNIWQTDKKGLTKTDELGGPIPCGSYSVTWNRKKGNWLDLTPVGSIPIIDSGRRRGFAVHGRGEWGSYGCVVIPDVAKLQQLCTAVGAVVQVTLSVVAGEIHDGA